MNYRLYLYKRANKPICEKPTPYDEGLGWIDRRRHSGTVGVMWSSTTFVMVDLIAETIDDQEEADDDCKYEETDSFEFDSYESNDD